MWGQGGKAEGENTMFGNLYFDKALERKIQEGALIQDQKKLRQTQRNSAYGGKDDRKRCPPEREKEGEAM